MCVEIEECKCVRMKTYSTCVCMHVCVFVLIHLLCCEMILPHNNILFHILPHKFYIIILYHKFNIWIYEYISLFRCPHLHVLLIIGLTSHVIPVIRFHGYFKVKDECSDAACWTLWDRDFSTPTLPKWWVWPESLWCQKWDGLLWTHWRRARCESCMRDPQVRLTPVRGTPRSGWPLCKGPPGMGEAIV